MTNNKRDELAPYTRGLKTNFSSAKDLYFNDIALPGFTKQKQNQPKQETKYARAARLGLCFKCFREDTNPQHRPRHRVFAYCPECYSKMDIGTEALVSKQSLEVEEWFGER